MALESIVALTGDVPPLTTPPANPVVPTLTLTPPTNPPTNPPTDPGPGTGPTGVGPVGGVGDGTAPSEPPPQVDLGGGTADPGGLPDEPTDPDNPYPDNPYPGDDPGYDAGDDDGCGSENDTGPGDAPVPDEDPGSIGEGHGSPISRPLELCPSPLAEGHARSEAELNVGQKSAQMGYTETVLNITFLISTSAVSIVFTFFLQKLQTLVISLLLGLILLLELSPHLSKIFSTSRTSATSGPERRISTFVVARSRAGLKSVPVGFIVLDELDEMTQENVELALERADGQVKKVGLDDFDGHDRQLRDQLPLQSQQPESLFLQVPLLLSARS
jgi:hypothetical protein